MQTIIGLKLNKYHEQSFQIKYVDFDPPTNRLCILPFLTSGPVLGMGPTVEFQPEFLRILIPR